ncbi:TPA_asm: Ad-PolB [Anelosimus tangle-web spider MELD virus]|nr:TPA_asm: Ad-PolB [Anelosimus tangle-web spider MELD virus]
MSSKVKKFAKKCTLNGKKLFLLSPNQIIDKEIVNCFCNYFKAKISYDKLIKRRLTVQEFVLFLIKNKKFVVKVIDNIEYFSLASQKVKKQILIIKKRFLVGIENTCVNCNRTFIHIHTCETDNISRKNYVHVKLPKLKKIKNVVDIILDIECAQPNKVHIPVLICIAFYWKSNLIEKSFLTVEAFFKYLKEFIFTHCPANYRVNLIGFNSSRYDFIFFMDEIRKYVTDQWTFQKQKYNYIQKDGAIIYNTFNVEKTSVWFIDILRYTGNVTSLKQIAKDLQVQDAKGAFPFQILDEENFEKDQDGFPHCNYFKSEEEYLSSKEMWESKNRCSFFDLLEHYCKLDVKVTMQVWYKIMEMYNSYVPFLDNIHITKFHGAPSLTKWVSFKMALEEENLKYLKVYNSGIQGGVKKIKKIKIFAPCFESYELWVKSIYGGWVSTYFTGICEEQLGMVDIVSHYPTSFTCYMPIWKPRPMVEDELKHFSENILSYDLESLPIFCCRVKVIPPSVITNFCSPLPQKCRKNILTWSYMSCEQNLNSVDIWLSSIYGFKFELLEGEIFPRKCILFKKFVETFAKMKDDGKKEKNTLKTKCGKIGLNSAIGKYGEKKDRTISHICKTSEDFNYVNLLLSNNNKFLTHTLMDIIVHDNYEEYIIKEYDVTNNKIPIQMISIMFAYSRVIKMDLIQRCKMNNFSIFSPRIKLPTPIYGDTDSVVITIEELKHLKKNSPNLFAPSVGFYNEVTKNFDYHVEVEDLFAGTPTPKTLYAIFFGLKAYMLFTEKGEKLRIKGHRISDEQSSCECGSGLRKYFCFSCLNDNFEKPINTRGVTLQHFYNCVRGNSQKLIYNRFERHLNRPIGQGKSPFSVKSSTVSISLNFKELCHKYHVKKNLCYPLTDLNKNL